MKRLWGFLLLSAVVIGALAPAGAFAQSTDPKARTAEAERSIELMPCPWQEIEVDGTSQCPTQQIEQEPDTGAENRLSEARAKSIYCDLVRILNSDLGTLAGLIVALLGLWFFISGKAFTGFIGVLIGSSVTMAPQFYVSFLDGLAGAFNETLTESRKDGDGAYDTYSGSENAKELTRKSLSTSNCFESFVRD
jgi:hypothetical protein